MGSIKNNIDYLLHDKSIIREVANELKMTVTDLEKLITEAITKDTTILNKIKDIISVSDEINNFKLRLKDYPYNNNFNELNKNNIKLEILLLIKHYEKNNLYKFIDIIMDNYNETIPILNDYAFGKSIINIQSGGYYNKYYSKYLKYKIKYLLIKYKL